MRLAYVFVMHIFIDESGTFALSAKPNSVSAVGALILPTQAMPGVTKLYSRLRRKLPKSRGEVKGRNLSETQIAEVAEIVRKVGGVFEAVVIDMGLHTQAGLQSHRDDQAIEITKHLGPEHHPNLVSGVWALRRQLETMPLQLYAQASAMERLMYHSINHAQTYFAFRSPKELSEYHWVIDAKHQDDGVSPWEEWWQKTILPAVESHSFREPFMMVEGGNYSGLDRYRTEPNEYKLQFAKPSAREDWFDLKKLLMEDFRFSSEPEIGLEMIDVLVNALRRSLAGNLGRPGWIALPPIMINRKHHCVQMISLTREDVSGKGLPYSHVMKDFRRGGRTMMPG